MATKKKQRPVSPKARRPQKASPRGSATKGIIDKPLPGNPRRKKPARPAGRGFQKKSRPRPDRGSVAANVIDEELPGNPKKKVGGQTLEIIDDPLPGNPKYIIIPPASFGGGPLPLAGFDVAQGLIDNPLPGNPKPATGGPAMSSSMSSIPGDEGTASTLGALLAHRRRRLTAFAQHAMNSASGLGKFRRLGDTAQGVIDNPLPGNPRPQAVASAMSMGGPAPSTGPAFGLAPGSSVQILEGVGALIVDAADVDRLAWEAGLGARVLENKRIFLPQPTELTVPAPAAPASPAHLQHINIAAARAKNLTGKGIIMGVLDTGIDAGHPEFRGKKVYFSEFDATGQAISTTPRDAGTHGTHVSGLIAGLTTGVAPEADLAVAAVLTYQAANGAMSGYFAQILAGLNWLLTHPFTNNANDPGVDAVNASLGGLGYNDYYYSTLAQARLITGTVMAAAIGNNGPQQNQHGSPGDYDIVVGTGAVDDNSQVAYFSDWGTVAEHGGLAKPDLCAPGVKVTSSVPGGGYEAMSGTSMASPIVAGTLGLLLQQNPAFSLDADGLIQRLYTLVRPIQGVTKPRGGRGELDLTDI